MLVKLSWPVENLAVEPKDLTKPKIMSRKDLFLAAVQRTPGFFPKAVSPQAAKLESFKGTCIFRKGHGKSKSKP